MKKADYITIPPLNSLADLLTFVEAIPGDRWCSDHRHDNDGRHCILGHLDVAYGDDAHMYRLRANANVDSVELARVNNGELHYCNDGSRPDDVAAVGEPVKQRVVEYIQNLLDGRAPATA